VGETTQSERASELVSTALHNLGALKVQTGQTAEGAQLLSRSLDLKTMLLGRDHPSVVQSRANLSSLLADMGRPEQAGLVRGGLSRYVTHETRPARCVTLQRPRSQSTVAEDAFRLVQRAGGHRSGRRRRGRRSG
jgi:hypothetical protein